MSDESFGEIVVDIFLEDLEFSGRQVIHRAERGCFPFFQFDTEVVRAMFG